MNYPTSAAEVDAMPEAPKGVKLFIPMLGPGQIFRFDSEDGKTVTLCGQVAGVWMKQTIDAGADHG